MAPRDDLIKKLTIYFITDRRLLPPGRDLMEALEEALKGGVRAIQLREKDLSPRELYELSLKVRSVTNRYNALFFINDRADVAMAVRADGVHLRSDSMAVKAVRDVVGQNMYIGVSTHTLEEIKVAKAQGADFVTFGPIYFTPSKARYGPPKGLRALREACRVSGGMPVIALGGVKRGLVQEVLCAGATGIGVVSAIMGAKNCLQAVRDLKTPFSSQGITI